MREQLIRMMFFFREHAVLRQLVIKSFRRRYANTLSGFLWTVFSPLILSLIIAFVFTQIMRSNVEYFVAYIISGMLPWVCFASCIQESAASFVENASLWRQFRVPLEFIPTALVILNFLSLCVALLVAAVVVAPSRPQVLLWSILLPVPLLLHFIFTAGAALFCASVYVRYKDIVHILPISLLFWLWASPVFYLASSFPSYIQQASRFNIIIPYLNLYRSIYYHCAFFSWKDITACVVLSLVSLWGGHRFFMNSEAVIKKTL
jgi:ABC-type polysaccharide/polyol phosphate export permease